MPPELALVVSNEPSEIQWTPVNLSLPIVSDENYAEATEFLKTVKTFQKRVTDFFRPLKEKAKAAHQALCDEEKKAMTPALDDEARVKAALVTYSEAQERKRLEEQRRLQEEARKQEEERRLAEAAALEAYGLAHGDAEMLATAQELVEAPVAAPVVTLPKATPAVSGISYRDVWKFRVVNAALVPREYLTVDETKIGGVVRAMKGTVTIPGVEIYSEKVASASGR